MGSTSNVVAAVHTFCTAASKPGHAQHGAVHTPAQWATLAGYPGSKASAMRQHIARRSGNGCGRSGRYGPQTASGMLALLALGTAHASASTAPQAAKVASKVRVQLAKAKAGKAGARQAGKARTATRKAARTRKATTGTGTAPTPATPAS